MFLIAGRGGRARHAAIQGADPREVREAVEKIGKEWGATLLYVPTGGGAGFLLIVEQGESARHRAPIRQLGQLGFGEAFGDVMTMGSVTNKDLLFCIDISGSMKTNSRIRTRRTTPCACTTTTTPDDSVGLIWFDSRSRSRRPSGRATSPAYAASSTRRATRCAARRRPATRSSPRAR